MILTLVQFLNQIRYEGNYKIKWDTGEPLDSYAWIADPAVVIRKSSRTEKVYIEQLSKTFHRFPECTERGWHVISQQRHNWNYPSLLRNKNHFVYWDAMIGRIISQRLRWKVLADFHFVTALLSAGNCPSWSLSTTEPNPVRSAVEASLSTVREPFECFAHQISLWEKLIIVKGGNIMSFAL